MGAFMDKGGGTPSSCRIGDNQIYSSLGPRPSTSDTESLTSESGSEPDEISDDLCEISRPPRANSQLVNYDGSKGLLQKRLRKAIDDTCHATEVPEKTGFVPRLELVKILDEASVAEELSRIKRSFKKRLRFWKSIHSPENIKKKAQTICAHPPPETTFAGSRELISKSFRKVFAILLLIERPGTIGKFIDEGVCDADLPLRKVPRKSDPKAFSLRRKDDPDSTLQCFQGWNRITLQQFELSQWKVLVPSFGRIEKRSMKPVTFQPEEILPFTYRERTSCGAHGEIFKVKIHPEHHNFTHQKEYFIVKTLLGKTVLGKEKEFEQEVGMLKRLCHSHSHLISLLGTYKHCEYYHLIFPWAECNLQTYWKTKNPDPPHDLDTFLWMARQCKGIAEALDRVHHHETSSVSSLFAVDSIAMWRPTTPTSPVPGMPASQVRGSRLVFGRHGDIKPTNLLWFPNPGDKGTIKISDFGTGVFSTTDSAPHTSTSVSHTLPYRPPECDLLDSIIDNSYDIWTLGCLYLEFITWFIGGWKLLEEFEELRKRKTQGLCRTNAYFEINGGQSKDEGVQPWEVRVKPAVLEFTQGLRRNPKFSAFLARFLDLIQSSMLIVKPKVGEIGKRRTSCGKVYRDLGEMIEKCNKDSNYAMER